MRVSLIAALARNRVIGKDNRLPWYLPEDLKRFRSLTRGHPIIMGRKTYESIGKLLPDRENIILTRNLGYAVDGAQVFRSLQDALGFLSSRHEKFFSEVFVIGGGQVYAEALPLSHRLYLTEVDVEVGGDAFFPDFSAEMFVEIERVPGRDQTSGTRYEFVTWERR